MKQTGASTNSPIRQRPPRSVNLVDDASLRSTYLTTATPSKARKSGGLKASLELMV